jgi:NADH:ubiquinone oxidoreductase subunit 6 (subunit J)
VFAIVVTERLVGERISQTSRHLAAGAAAAIVLGWAISSTIWQRPLAMVRPPMVEDLTRVIGDTVQTRFVLPFELLALLMLAGLMGAIYFARPED